MADCPFCGKRMAWMREDIYACEAHGRFEAQRVTIKGFQWLEAK